MRVRVNANKLKNPINIFCSVLYVRGFIVYKNVFVWNSILFSGCIQTLSL